MTELTRNRPYPTREEVLGKLMDYEKELQDKEKEKEILEHLIKNEPRLTNNMVKLAQRRIYEILGELPNDYR